jgi:hypothetical protein
LLCQVDPNGFNIGFAPIQALAMLPEGGQLFLTFLAVCGGNVQSFHGSGDPRRALFTSRIEGFVFLCHCEEHGDEAILGFWRINAIRLFRLARNDRLFSYFYGPGSLETLGLGSQNRDLVDPYTK